MVKSMEKSKVIQCYNVGEHFVKTCLGQIASLERDNDKELRLFLKGTSMVEISYKAAESFAKVCADIINGEDGADKLKGKVFDLREKIKQLYDRADKNNLINIRTISDSMLGLIGEVEEWTDSIPQETTQAENNSIPENCNNDYSDDSGKENKPPTKEDIVKKLEGAEKFVPKKAINLYGVYYSRLTKGIRDDTRGVRNLNVIRKITDDDNENIKLFELCVEKANISMLINAGKKSYARLFMNDIASLFSEPEKYRKAAAKSFNLKNSKLGGVGGKYKKDYRKLMRDLFDEDADYR